MTLEEEIFVRLITTPEAERLEWQEQLKFLRIPQQSYIGKIHYPQFCTQMAIKLARDFRAASMQAGVS